MRNGFPALIFVVSLLLPQWAAAAETAWRAEWEKTVAAAEKEGQLVIYTGGAASQTKIEEAFQSAYPKIKVTSVTGRGSQFGPKIIAERRAGKYLVDFFIGGKGTAHATLYPAKVLAPIQPLLVLPEVLDQSKWWQGKHRYVDAEGKYIFAFVGNGTIVELRYNTNLVSPKEFTTYWDLLNAKWKGKIVATDPRMSGMDTPVLFFYYHPKLGPEFLRRLYGEMDVTIARDYRQPIDWLAAGKFAVCIPCNTRETEKAIKQGLPLGETLELKEGGTLSAGGGTISFLDKAPHPNAAKLFVNWLLSREGQIEFQKRDGSDSFRVDIPKHDVSSENRRIEGMGYFEGDDPRFSDRRPADKLLNDIFGKTGK
ncbi:MAG TPA: extracellular solute-binding protein [Candidatus Udaeobacter sp.]|nr:extracellular solute-binding protein [Candidatus Udaeobacter sp.]